jgi:hypothetical protein
VRPRLILLAALVAAVCVPAAHATAVTGGELRSLARQARSDPAALQRLRAVTSVDGAPADLHTALAGASGAELQRRLAALSTGSGRSVDAAGARREAGDVLSGSRYQPESEGFHPLRGVLGWIGDRLAPLGRPFTWLGDHLPGGMNAVWALLGLAALVASAVVARRIARGRLTAARTAPSRRGRHADEADPAALEREADEAERAGDYERAVRLRFRAGLLRLARLRAIDDGVTRTSGQLARQLRSPEFDRVAGAFDEVVYGGRPAGESDAADARGRWAEILGEARRR